MKKLLLFLLGVLIALPSMARDFKYEYEGQTITYTVIDEDAKTCRTKAGYIYYGNDYPGNFVSGNLILPSNPKDGDVEYTLIEIGDYAFRHRSGLTSVVIPNSIQTIGKYAFEDCSGLTSVVIGNSVTSIGWWAFSGCGKLIKAAYPNTFDNLFGWGVTNISYPADGAIIEDGFVYGPDKSAIYFAPLSLEGEYTIPNSVTSIGDYAFYNCSSMTSIEIPGSVQTIGSSAFSGCSGLTSVDIPSSVQTIGSSAFSGCSGLTSVDIPSSVTSIGWEAFSNCSGLNSVTVADGETALAFEKGAFYNTPIETLFMGRDWTYTENAAISTSLKSVTIGNQVTSIPSYAFLDCSGLTSVEIPNSVTYIGWYAFCGCSGLMSVVIPNSVISSGLGVFNGCSGLKKSAYPNTIGNPFNNNGICIRYPADGAIIEDGWVYGPDKSAIYFAPLSLEGEFSIPTTVETIGDNAFNRCSSLTSVVIPNSVQTIGDYAFYGCI